MRLRGELGGCLHVQGEMRALVVIVVEKGIGTLLSKLKVSGLEGRVTELFTALGINGSEGVQRAQVERIPLHHLTRLLASLRRFAFGRSGVLA